MTFYIFRKVSASVEAVYALCVRTLIPAVVTECQLLTAQSSSSNGSRQVLALSSLPLAFCFVHDKVNCVAREDALGCKEKK
jgi:hypothetical protein